jgi:hypothetical protein
MIGFYILFVDNFKNCHFVPDVTGRILKWPSNLVSTSLFDPQGCKYDGFWMHYVIGMYAMIQLKWRYQGYLNIPDLLKCVCLKQKFFFFFPLSDLRNGSQSDSMCKMDLIQRMLYAIGIEGLLGQELRIASMSSTVSGSQTSALQPRGANSASNPNEHGSGSLLNTSK